VEWVPERDKPEMDHVRDALREHDERQRAEDEDDSGSNGEPDEPVDDEDDE
jgi:hypothetical protein